MSNRSELEELKLVIKKSNETIDAMIADVAALQIKGSNLIFQIIEDEKLFHNSIWDIKTEFPAKFYLEYSDSNQNKMYSSLKLLCDEASFSNWIDLEDGIQFRLEEDFVAIYFDEVQMILPFVNKYKMKITGSDIFNRLQILKRESSALEQIVHQFAIKK